MKKIIIAFICCLALLCTGVFVLFESMPDIQVITLTNEAYQNLYSTDTPMLRNLDDNRLHAPLMYTRCSDGDSITYAVIDCADGRLVYLEYHETPECDVDTDFTTIYNI